MASIATSVYSQSHHTGIERTQVDSSQAYQDSSQSHHTGIERHFETMMERMLRALNRTTLELKVQGIIHPGFWYVALNRTTLELKESKSVGISIFSSLSIAPHWN